MGNLFDHQIKYFSLVIQDGIPIFDLLHNELYIIADKQIHGILHHHAFHQMVKLYNFALKYELLTQEDIQKFDPHSYEKVHLMDLRPYLQVFHFVRMAYLDEVKYLK